MGTEPNHERDDDNPPRSPQSPGQSESMSSFVIIWAGQAFSLLGSRLVQFALIWYLTDSTGSATVLAMATLVGLLPTMLLGPFAGALVDRWDRRTVMMVSDLVVALATLLLAALFATDLAQVWHIYGLMFVRALGGAFHWPAMQASTTLMVPERHLSRVGGMNQTLQGLASIAMPPLGALLLLVLPMQGILAIDVATAIPAIVSLLFISVPSPARHEQSDGTAARKTSVLADVHAGLQFVWGWTGLLLMISMGILINLLVGPGVSLLPILVRDHLGGGALQLAWMQAAGGVGTVLGGLLLGVWGGFRRRIVTALVALTMDGLAILAIGLTPASGLVFAMGAFFVAGLVEPSIHGSFGAIAQAAVPPEMQGRVFGLARSLGTAMAPIGLAVAGPLADAYGVQLWFILGGIATVAMGLGGFFVPALLQIEDRGRAGHRGRQA